MSGPRSQRENIAHASIKSRIKDAVRVNWQVDKASSLWQLDVPGTYNAAMPHEVL